MICPKCQSDSISFLQVWLRSGLGTHVCPHCQAVCRVRRSVPLILASCTLGFFVGALALLFMSWKIMAVGGVIVTIADAYMDRRFRKLDLVAPDEPPSPGQ